MTFRESQQASWKAVANFERLLGRNLPSDYRKFANEVNGGLPDKPIFDNYYFKFVFPTNDPVHNPLDQLKSLPVDVPERLLPISLEGQVNYSLFKNHKGLSHAA